MASSRFAGPSIRGLRPPTPNHNNDHRQSGRSSAGAALKGSEAPATAPPYLPCANERIMRQPPTEDEKMTTVPLKQMIRTEIILEMKIRACKKRLLTLQQQLKQHRKQMRGI